MVGKHYQDLKRWKFNEVDRKTYLNQFWHCPARLVKSEMWANLWRTRGTTRGGGAVSCILPVLALHISPDENDAADNWTRWAYLSRRRVAALAGVNKDTVTDACKRLVDAKLAEMKRWPRAKHEGGYKMYYRLATSLYPQDNEPYAKIPAHLFYGGTWFLLPSPAYRHMYVVLICLAPITDEDAASLSARDLEQYSGLRRSTVVEALQALTVPMFGKNVDENTGRKLLDISLVIRREARPKKPTWYIPDQRAWWAFWPSDFLDSPELVEATRQRFWPHLVKRRIKQKKRARQ
jgi:hypothetical protein